VDQCVSKRENFLVQNKTMTNVYGKSQEIFTVWAYIYIYTHTHTHTHTQSLATGWKVRVSKSGEGARFSGNNMTGP